MQVNEDLAKGTGKPLTDALGPESITSNSIGFCMVLPICINPTAAQPALLMRGQPGLPARTIFGFSDRAAGELVFNCCPGVCDVDTCKQLLLTAE